MVILDANVYDQHHIDKKIPELKLARFGVNG